MPRHDSGRRTGLSRADWLTLAFYFLVPFLLIFSRGPFWVALLVGAASAGIGWWRG